MRQREGEWKIVLWLQSEKHVPAQTLVVSLPYAWTFNPSACQEDRGLKLDHPGGQHTRGQEKESVCEREREQALTWFSILDNGAILWLCVKAWNDARVGGTYKL